MKKINFSSMYGVQGDPNYRELKEKIGDLNMRLIVADTVIKRLEEIIDGLDPNEQGFNKLTDRVEDMEIDNSILELQNRKLEMQNRGLLKTITEMQSDLERLHLLEEEVSRLRGPINICVEDIYGRGGVPYETSRFL